MNENLRDLVNLRTSLAGQFKKTPVQEWAELAITMQNDGTSKHDVQAAMELAELT